MRTGITYHDVEEAANKISKQGQNPTIEKIRGILGTGSNTTISKYLKRYKESEEYSKTVKNKSYRKGYEDAVRDVLRFLKTL